MKSHRIVITGAAGFIGSSLAHMFYELGHCVLGIDNMSFGYKDNLDWAKDISSNAFTFVKIDICSSELVQYIQKNDIVIHCAAIAPLPINQENPSFSITNNVSGTANLLEACRLKGAQRIILASTSAVYENSTSFPSRESDPIHPTILYSLGKKFCEDLCDSFYVNYGLTYTICRFFNVYGPHHDCLRKNPPLIAYIVKSFLEGKQPLLHSNGEQKRDYIYIDDILEFFKKIVSNLDTCKNKTYNLCSGESISVKDIVNYIQKYMNIQIDPIYRDPTLLWEKNDALWRGEMPFSKERLVHEVEKYSLGDSTAAQTDFSWKVLTPFSEGILKTLEHMMRLLS